MTRPPRQPGDTEADDGFLGRWSRRKTAIQDEHLRDIQKKSEDEAAPPQQVVSSDGLQDGESSVPLEGPLEEPVLRDEDMPPLETIDETTDVKDFFSPGVSETLRKAALRKFFHSPGFNVVDGLDDYDDDFRNFEALGDLITADMRHQMELKEEREKAEFTEDDVGEEQVEVASDDSDEDPAEENTEDSDQDVEQIDAETDPETNESDDLDDNVDKTKERRVDG